MSTLSSLQHLSDGEFHRLGDHLLRRIDARYRSLRSYGINERGRSIKGQPDSYVGDSPGHCTIAVQYTVQRANWWSKVVDDVKEAVEASDQLQEIVAVIPHNRDRDGPRKAGKDWLTQAKHAAESRSFRLIDGVELAGLLDEKHQDLRHEYLSIPYSRLNGESILASARSATQEVLDILRAGGRFQPERYVHRFADAELYRLWQLSLRCDDSNERRERARMIAFVDDSGTGKTSLVCSFASALALVVPTLLIQARDLSCDAEDALVRHAMSLLQGVLEPHTRASEEVAITRNMPGRVPLTVVLDGLDEIHDPRALKRAVTCWLRSRLGERSVLIATARPDFWKGCSDPEWTQWMPVAKTRGVLPGVSTVGDIGESRPDETCFRLPGLLSDDELNRAWQRSGRDTRSLYELPPSTRNELRHAFTLRVYLDLTQAHSQTPPKPTRSSLIDLWLRRRLETESARLPRCSAEMLAKNLKLIAKRLDTEASSSLSVDQLTEIDRFDPVNPPGPAMPST